MCTYQGRGAAEGQDRHAVIEERAVVVGGDPAAAPVGRARGLVAYPQLVALKVGARTLATHDGSRPVADVLGSCDGVVVDVLGDVKETEKSKK